MYGMTTINAKVIDGFHLELEKKIPEKTGAEVFVRIIEKNGRITPRSRGDNVDSAGFVDTL